MASEKMLNCPFNPDHKICQSRYEAHLIRCSGGNHAHEVCPFNAKHHVKMSELRAHISSCPDKNRLAYEKVLVELDSNASIQPLINDNIAASNHTIGDDNPSPFFQQDSQWDDEMRNSKVPIIQPIEKAVTANFKESYCMLKPAERRRIREQMIEKFKQSQQSGEINSEE